MNRSAPRAVAALTGAVLLLAACSNNSGAYNARFNAPADIVAFTGVTRKNPGLHDYLAVASSRGDDLVFFDPADGRAVLSPGAVFPLSISTDPRPLRLAATTLGDRAAGGADLLVAVSAGSLDLQVVQTWSEVNRIDPIASVTLAPLVGDAQIVSVAAFAPPGAGAATPRARLLVGLTGGRLAVVDFTRDPATGGVIPGTPVVKSIGIDAAAIALEPGGTRAFLATSDPLPGSGATPVFGVAMIDVGADPAQAWPVTAIDAHAPTRAVAVARVSERLVDATNFASADTFETVARFRIYAVLDPSGCGPSHAINCGVAMLDEKGLLPDPSGELPYRAPLPVPGIPSGIAIMFPPASGNARLAGDALNPGLPLMLVQPSTRNTTAVAGVTSSDGRVYLYDLARFSPVNSSTALVQGTGVSSAISAQPADVVTEGSANFGKTMFLGLWTDVATAAAPGTSVVIDPSFMRSYIQVTPGFTPSDVFHVTWQGELPGLLARRGVIGRTPGGETYVAIQGNAGTSAQPVWVGTVDVADPSLGLHGGDLLTFAPDDPALCATGDAARPYPDVAVSTDTPLLAPDPARFPAGAVKLAPGSCFDQQLAAGQTATATVTIRATGLVLTSGQLGYLGRPVFDKTFALAHQDETTLTGEALAIARKLRRTYYPAEAPCFVPTRGCYAGFPAVSDPLAPGPVLSFRVGLQRLDGPAPSNPADPAVLALLARGSRIIAQTITGPTVTGLRPSNGGMLPTGIVTYDPTSLSGHENDGTHFYAVYRDDQVLDMIPSILGGYVRSIR